MIRQILARFTARRDKGPIASVEAVSQFASTRAAFVSQKKLYGYVKERIGTRYPKMFADEIFVESINIAKLEVFAASLADLTCFCVATATAGTDFENREREFFARLCYRGGIDRNTDREAEPAKRDAWISAFDRRVAHTPWHEAGPGEHHFTESAPALIRWAPIAEKLKKFDEEIVRNSIRFAWLEVRRDFLKRVEPEAVARDWRATNRS